MGVNRSIQFYSFPIQILFISYSNPIHFLFKSYSFPILSHSVLFKILECMGFLVVIQSHSALFSAYLYGPTSSKKLAQYKLGKVKVLVYLSCGRDFEIE